ncbi:aldo/keto reductase [Levilactobacillus yonginensis]|uniref:aldo/keto reductase n=1 Tax=Levilactobacillus yonginensis TaxID=1054041 RepID=UPI000F7A92A9|nr:aldo/keto reductase [Levilactobacillus yonginensis]
MKYHKLGQTNFDINEVSLGTWQLGAKWRDPFDEINVQNTLAASYDTDANFFSTADMYQDDHSDRYC